MGSRDMGVAWRFDRSRMAPGWTMMRSRYGAERILRTRIARDTTRCGIPKTADQDQWRNSRTEPSPLTRPNPLHLIEHGLQPLATTRSRHPAGRVIVPAASQADARTRRPAESASTLAICFASSAALLRLGTIRNVGHHADSLRDRRRSRQCDQRLVVAIHQPVARGQRRESQPLGTPRTPEQALATGYRDGGRKAYSDLHRAPPTPRPWSSTEAAGRVTPGSAPGPGTRTPRGFPPGPERTASASRPSRTRRVAPADRRSRAAASRSRSPRCRS